MEEDKSSVSVRFSRRVKFLLAGLLVGVIVGILGTLAIQNFNPEDPVDQTENVSIVFERIVERNELVSVSQDYSIVEKSTDVDRLFDIIENPLTVNSFWYRYVGTIKAGVDMEQAAIESRGATVIVTLPEPKILSNTPNMEQSGVLEEHNNVFNAIDVADVDAMQRECVERSEENALAGGLLEEARVEAENNIRDVLLAAMGEDYVIEFNWIEGSTEEAV